MEFAKLIVDLKNNKIIMKCLDVNFITSTMIGVYDEENKKYISLSRSYENKVVENKTLNKISILVELSPVGICKAEYLIKEKLIELNRNDLVDIVIDYGIGFYKLKSNDIGNIAKVVADNLDLDNDFKEAYTEEVKDTIRDFLDSNCKFEARCGK